MNSGRTVFSQLMDFLPWQEFRQCVSRYDGDRRVRSLTCRDQFLEMAFGQLALRDSLRDIVVALGAREKQLYHMGLRGSVSRSTLADANEKRDWRIFGDFAMGLIRQTRGLYQDEPLAVDLESLVYAVDSTTISLCLSVFPWARYKRRLGAIKLHTQLDLRGSIPSFIHITDGTVHDVRFLDRLIIEPGAFYVLDRGYLDYARLHRVHEEGGFFITRPRSSFQFRRVSSAPVDKASGVLCDQTVTLVSFYPRKAYPDRLRRISYVDREQRKRLVFMTNNFVLPALTVAHLYKCRWQVELFFRWIKQHLRIRAFFGTSENAVHAQVWIAISVYVLVALARKRLGLTMSHYQMLQILSLTLFEKVPLQELLTPKLAEREQPESPKQLMLFDI
jgi:hypothetical protein